MTESVQKAINDITYRSKVFPEEAFQTISKNRECFPLIMEMASFPADILDYLIGDTVTEGLPQILYHTYNGDLELLKKAIAS